MTVRILQGDCREVLPTLPSESVHCIVSSPPYYGLRDYGTGEWEGGDAWCEHTTTRRGHGDEKQSTSAGTSRDSLAGLSNCRKCGARRIDRQIGLEQTPDSYVAELVAVFRECRRVLRDDGTLWLNLGDSYAANRSYQVPSTKGGPKHSPAQGNSSNNRVPDGLKSKDLLGIPWLVAFALRADGWYLRSDIIWSKPNPMPESVRDRPTKAHEYIFLLSKNERYFFDQDAVQEASAQSTIDRAEYAVGGTKTVAVRRDGNGSGRRIADYVNGRNIRSVWTVATQPYSEAHFATFPPDLIEPCIKAGTSEKGCCAKCGAPWKREVERSGEWRAQHEREAKHNGDIYRTNPGGGIAGPNTSRIAVERGWSPSCKCEAAVVPCTVLDPFGGAGTTGMVADRLQRNAVLIELNPDYAAMAQKRLQADGGMFAEVAA